MSANSGPVGIGQDIEEVIEARKEKERQELKALDLISKHIAGYLGGGPDLETEDVELGRRLAVDVEVIRLRWKVVREKRRNREAKEASFILLRHNLELKSRRRQPRDQRQMSLSRRWSLLRISCLMVSIRSNGWR